LDVLRNRKPYAQSFYSKKLAELQVGSVANCASALCKRVVHSIFKDARAALARGLSVARDQSFVPQPRAVSAARKHVPNIVREPVPSQILQLASASIVEANGGLYLLSAAHVAGVERVDAQGQVFSVTDEQLIGNVLKFTTSLEVVPTSADVCRATIVASDVAHDLILLKPNCSLEGQPIRVARRDVAVGSTVWAVGFPFTGSPRRWSSQLVVAAKVTDTQYEYSLDFKGVPPTHVTTVAQNFKVGMSGGPVLNEAGELVGMVQGTVVLGKATGYAISRSDIVKLLERV